MSKRSLPALVTSIVAFLLSAPLRADTEQPPQSGVDHLAEITTNCASDPNRLEFDNMYLDGSKKDCWPAFKKAFDEGWGPLKDGSCAGGPFMQGSDDLMLLCWNGIPPELKSTIWKQSNPSATFVKKIQDACHVLNLYHPFGWKMLTDAAFPNDPAGECGAALQEAFRGHWSLLVENKCHLEMGSGKWAHSVSCQSGGVNKLVAALKKIK